MTAPGPLVVPARYCGPPGSGNGGWVAGALASRSGLTGDGAAVEVTLREPPPLEVPLDVRDGEDGRVALAFGGAVIAEARLASLGRPPVPPVDPDAAEEAMSRYAGLAEHPFPTCFVCGVDRPAPDGLGLRPGRLADRPDCVATGWRPDATLAGPDGRLPAHLVWAALDCPGAWTTDLTGRPMVLGRMTAAVDALPHAGDRCVVVGRLDREEGRKSFTTTTAYDADGRVLGRAESVWIALRATPA